MLPQFVDFGQEMRETYFHRVKQAELYNELLLKLAASSGSDRQVWAKCIVDEGVDIIGLCDLLYKNKVVAMRFLWLLSDIALVDPKMLYDVLPYLFQLRDKTSIPDLQYSFSKYWNYCGVPEEHEEEAIDLLFKWIEDPKVSVHIKTNSLRVLYKLVKGYPDLKNELSLVLDDQLEKNSVSFKRMASKVLTKL